EFRRVLFRSDPRRFADRLHVRLRSVVIRSMRRRLRIAFAVTRRSSILSEITATIVRPWYVIGPGHRWPMLLQPLYWIAQRLPGARSESSTFRRFVRPSS